MFLQWRNWTKQLATKALNYLNADDWQEVKLPNWKVPVPFPGQQWAIISSIPKSPSSRAVIANDPSVLLQAFENGDIGTRISVEELKAFVSSPLSSAINLEELVSHHVYPKCRARKRTQ